MLHEGAATPIASPRLPHPIDAFRRDHSDALLEYLPELNRLICAPQVSAYWMAVGVRQALLTAWVAHWAAVPSPTVSRQQKEGARAVLAPSDAVDLLLNL